MAFGATDVDPLIVAVDALTEVQRCQLAFSMTPLTDVEISDANAIPLVYIYNGGMDGRQFEEGENACSQGTHELIVVDYLLDHTSLTAVTKAVRDVVLAFNFSDYHGSVAFAYPPRVGGSTSEIRGIDGPRVWWQDKFEVRLDHRIGVAI